MVDRGPAEAERTPASIAGLVAPLGGLDGVVITDLDRLMAELARLPDAASAVIRLADGVRTIAQILRDAPFDEVLTARILARLASSRILVPAASNTREPTPVPPIAIDDPIIGADLPRPELEQATGWDESFGLPTDDEFEGAGVDEDIRGWLENERVPDVFLSDDSFAAAFASHADRADGGLPPPLLPPVETESGPEPRAEDRFPEIPPPVNAPAVAPATAAPSAAPSRAPSSVPSPAPIPTPARAAQDRAPTFEDEDPAESNGPSRRAWVGVIGMLAAVIALASWALHRPRVNDDGPHPLLPRPPVAERARPEPTLAVAPVASSTRGASAVPAQNEILALASGRPAIATPDAPEDVKRAEALLNAGNYPDAGKLLSQLRTSRPNDPAVWVLSGQLHVDSGSRLAAAREASDRAIALDPRFYRAWVLKGSVLQFLGQRKEARDAYAKALEIEPDHPMSAELRAIVDQLR